MLGGYVVRNANGQALAFVYSRDSDAMELSDLERHDPNAKRAKAGGRGKVGSVAPKYRNPQDPLQTWAGWSAAALAACGDQIREEA
jgi:hypothetical protein